MVLVNICLLYFLEGSLEDKFSLLYESVYSFMGAIYGLFSGPLVRPEFPCFNMPPMVKFIFDLQMQVSQFGPESLQRLIHPRKPVYRIERIFKIMIISMTLLTY